MKKGKRIYPIFLIVVAILFVRLISDKSDKSVSLIFLPEKERIFFIKKGKLTLNYENGVGVLPYIYVKKIRK